MKLSIVIPAYNEEKTIEEIIRRIRAVDLGAVTREIIVVDDGSRDRTREILKKIPDITYVFHEKNLGKGGAVKTGFRKVTGDIVIIQDADLEYDPKDYPAMIAPILSGAVDVAVGFRIQPDSDGRRHKSLYWLSWFGNHLITWTTNILFWADIREYEACYKAFSKKVIDAIDIETNNFDFDNELMCKVLKAGYATVDVPIRYHPRNYNEGKKINWRHGFLILWTVIRCRFTMRK